MTPTRQRLLVTLLAAAGLASAVLAATYLAIGTDQLRVHHCYLPNTGAEDTFGRGCGRVDSHLGATALVIIIVPSAAALACVLASMLSGARRKGAMLLATAALYATAFASHSYVFLPALVFEIAAVLVAFQFNPARWFWDNVSWRFRPPNHTEL